MNTPAVIKAHGVLTLADGSTHPFTVHLPDEPDPQPRIITGISTRDPGIGQLLQVTARDIADALMTGRITAVHRLADVDRLPHPVLPPLPNGFPDGAA